MGPRAQRPACGLSPILHRGGALDAGQSQQSEGYRDLGETPVPHARRSGRRLRDRYGRYRRVCARWKIRHRGFQERARAARGLRGQATARSAALPRPLILRPRAPCAERGSNQVGPPAVWRRFEKQYTILTATPAKPTDMNALRLAGKSLLSAWNSLLLGKIFLIVRVDCGCLGFRGVEH